ncbi:MAG: zinc ribbon domain-containing protein [Acidobacteriota bacterium]
MHCPSCGQQQISQDTKFCSRCGFPLGLIAEILAQGGFLPQLAELHKKKSLYTKKNGVAFSVFWFIFFVPLLTSIFGGVFNIEVLGEIFALIGIFGGLMIFIASLVFLPSSKPAFTPRPPMMMPGVQPASSLYGVPQSHGALPPQQSVPANAYTAPQPGKWRDTNELARNSVIEETTRLLKKEER